MRVENYVLEALLGHMKQLNFTLRTMRRLSISHYSPLTIYITYHSKSILPQNASLIHSFLFIPGKVFLSQPLKILYSKTFYTF